MASSRTLDIIIKAQDNASQTLKGLEGQVQKNKKAFQTMAAAGTAAFAAVAGTIAASMKTYNEFDTTLNKIAGLVGINREVIKGWEKDIKNLSVETGKSSRELADALYFITSAGIKGSEAIDVLEMSAKAAAAGLGEAKVVADLVTSAMNAYGAETLNAQQATDILVATVREGKAEPEELAASMGMVLPIASELGVSFDQVGAAIAGMTRTGTNAATASTQLRQILASLLNPTTQASEALDSFGTSASEIRMKLREEGLIDTLVDLDEKFGDNEEAASLVFGNIRALSGVLDLLGGNAEENIAIFEKMAESGGALDMAFQATEDSTRAWERLKAQLESVKIVIGNAVAPAMISLLESITPIVEKIAEWIEKNPELTSKILLTVGAVGGLVAVFGLLALALPAITALIAVLASPITLIIAAFGLLAVAVVKFVDSSKYILEQFGQFFRFLWMLVIKPLIDGVGNWFAALGDKIRDIFTSLKDFFVNIWEEIKNIFQAAVDWITAKLQPLLNMVDKVKDAASWVGEKAGSAVSWVGEKASAGVSAIKNAFPFAEGGVVTSPTLGLVGESGPEAIIPLNRARPVGGSSVNVYVYGDVSGDELVEKVKEGIMRSMRIDSRFSL